MECAEPDCTERASVRLHIPWTENKVVCAAHARGLAQADGIVPEPLEDTETETGYSSGFAIMISSTYSSSIR